MRDIASAKFNQYGSIEVILADGTTATIPDFPPGWPYPPPPEDPFEPDPYAPRTPPNMDRVELQEWVDAGNGVIEPFVPPPPAADRSNYDAMLERRMDAALAVGDTDSAFQILLQLNSN